jgi:hypothetical protein
MIPEDDAYTDLDRIDPNNPAMVEYWAEQWNISPMAVLAAISKVGPLLEDIVLEIWKLRQRRGNAPN